MTVSSYYLLPPLPQGLEGLAELALDLRWSWNHTADRLWEYIDSDLWNATGNPWLILQTVATSRMKALATDADFRKQTDAYMMRHQKALGAPTWFEQAYPQMSLNIAYFSMEFGVSEALPLYAGGLGVLAGDYLKASCDLDLPLVGVGLLYQEGYFHL